MYLTLRFFTNLRYITLRYVKLRYDTIRYAIYVKSHYEFHVHITLRYVL